MKLFAKSFRRTAEWLLAAVGIASFGAATEAETLKTDRLAIDRLDQIRSELIRQIGEDSERANDQDEDVAWVNWGNWRNWGNQWYNY